MAENLPVNFAIPGEQILANYSFTQLISGLGFLSLNCATYRDTDSIEYFLDDNIDVSDAGEYYVGSVVGNNANVTVATKSFTTSTFNNPRTIQGKAWLKLPVAGNNVTYWFEVSLLKVLVDNTTTSLASYTTYSKTSGLPGVPEYLVTAFDVAKTGIKVGEKLRITLVFKATGASSGANTAWAYDASNSARSITVGVNTYSFPAGNTNTNLNIPFRIEQ